MISIILLSIIIAAALLLFISEWVRVDIVALLIMGALILSGILSPGEAINGFSNPATVTVLFMYLLSAALLKTGALSHVGVFFAGMYKRNFTLGLILMMILIAFFSAFINNTPIVALFIPIIIQTAREAKISPAKLLMPLSYSAIFGGMCTLIGTSTNILVDGIAKQNGEAGFSMFTLTPVGLLIALGGILYMAFVGKKLIPERELKGTRNYHLHDYITEIELFDQALFVNSIIREAPIVTEYGMDILEVIREDEVFSVPAGDFRLKSGDILKVRCNVERLQKLKDNLRVRVAPFNGLSNEEIISKDTSLVELIITSNSRFEGKTLHEVNFRQRYRAIPLAIKHREDIINDRLMNMELKSGDIILVEIKTNRLNKLKEEMYQQNQPFILLTEYPNTEINWKKFIIVIGCLLGVVLLSTFGILDVLGGTLIASAVLILTGCLPIKDIYDVVDWKVIFLLAGALSLGMAMEKTGLSLIIATHMIEVAGPLGPVAILSAFFLLTSIFTEMMSNNASAALIAPIAISTAHQLGVSAMPFLIAVTLAASASFMTPVGYQTNTMIYGAGGYKFKDFTRVGIWLNLLFWILSTFLIPMFYEW